MNIEDQTTYRKEKKHGHWAKRATYTTILLLIITITGSISPVTAHASLFTFFNELLNGSFFVYNSVYTTGDNSQNITLLKAALNVDPNPSKGGGNITIIDDSLLVPELGLFGSRTDIDERRQSDQISIYVVREGDSLSQIADMFGVSVSTIVWANDLKSEALIQTGQTLVILPVTGVRHIVQKGETLASVAKKYNGNLEEIMLYNELTTESVLTAGDTITIPDGEIETPRYVAVRTQASVRGSDGPVYAGFYSYPVVGGKKTQGLHGYNAVDIGAPFGTPVLAAADGEVLLSKGSGWNGGYGNYIVIKHDNGTQTLYAHNSRNIVFFGQRVVKGQVIGYVGSTGKSTGPHLHVEVRGATNPF